MNPESETTIQREITDQIFVNSPTMLALCLTTVGLIKIYAAIQRISTLADDFLALCLIAYLVATIFAYLSLRSRTIKRRNSLARVADLSFIFGLGLTTLVAVFVVFSLAG